MAYSLGSRHANMQFSHFRSGGTELSGSERLMLIQFEIEEIVYIFAWHGFHGMKIYLREL